MEFLDETHLVMSEGLYGNSGISLMEVIEPSSEGSNGKIITVKRVDLEPNFFGEGTAILKGKIY